LADIDTWVDAEPWRERLRAHQMVALYRSGRQIEALAAYDELRGLLVHDFGVEPHTDLKRLQGRVLRRDPALLANRGADPQSRERVPAPAPARTSPDIDLTVALDDGLVDRLREFTRERAHVVLVDGGPRFEKAWLVAELPCRPDIENVNPIDEKDPLRRISLSDWLSKAR
jgi:hypothetical protein